MSSLNSLITFSEDDSPESIAEAIMSVDLNQPYDILTKIKELDEKFVNDIRKLLQRSTDKWKQS